MPFRGGQHTSTNGPRVGRWMQADRPAIYRPRRPRASPLWQCVSRHLSELRASGRVRRVVEQNVLERFLECGDTALRAPRHPLRRLRPRPAARLLLQDALLPPRAPPRSASFAYGEWVEASVRSGPSAPAVCLHRSEAHPAVLRLPPARSSESSAASSSPTRKTLPPRAFHGTDAKEVPVISVTFHSNGRPK